MEVVSSSRSIVIPPALLFPFFDDSTLKTWAFSTVTLLAWLYSNDMEPGSEDFAFVCGSLTVMSMWRYIFNSVARFLP